MTAETSTRMRPVAVPMEGSHSAATARLRHLVYDEDGTATNLDLIAVAGCATRPVDTWRLLKWKSVLSTPDVRVRLLAFHPQVGLDDHFSWLALLGQGLQLLEAIHERRVRLNEKERPLVFISHSLGGMIVKQALAVANQQHDTYHHVLTATLGLIFMGTPHSMGTMGALNEKMTLLFQSLNSDLSRQTLSRIANDSNYVLDLASRFEDVMLRADVLSIYETKETRVKDSRFFPRSRKYIIVDRDTGNVKALHEKSIGIGLAHDELPDIFDVKEGTAIKLVLRWVRRVLDDSPSNILARLQAYHLSESPKASDVALRSDGTTNDALRVPGGPDTRSSQPPVSNGSANYGSSNFEYEMVSILKGFESSLRQAKLPCFMTTTFDRNEVFFGRTAELEELDNRLLPLDAAMASSETGSMRYVALCGMPGLGKTELALEFMHTRKDRFDAIFWIRADEKEVLENDFSQIAVRLELDEPSELLNPIVNRELARGWLANPKRLLNAANDTVGQAEAKWLVIFDNADDPDILNDLKPLFGNGSILVTSRDPNAKTAFSPEPRGIDLEPFSDKEGGQWLREMIPKGSERQARDISQTLGGLPLAITQMASLMRKQYLDYSDFLELYANEEEHEALHTKQWGVQRGTARGTIGSIWEKSKLSDGAHALLEIMSFLDPDMIQEQIFHGLSERVVSLTAFPRTPGAFAAARGELIQASLLRRKEESRILGLHRLLRDSVRAKMSPSHETDVFAAAVAMISCAWPEVTHDKLHSTDRWEQCESLHPHILALRRYEEKRTANDAGAANFRLARLLHQAGWWQHERGYSHHAKSSLRIALEIGEHAADSIEGRLDLLCDINYALAAAANETNDRISCTRHSQKLLAMRLENGAQRDIRLAVAYNESGIGFLMNDNSIDAEQCFRKAIETYRSLANFWVGMISLPLANLGLSYWLQGRFDEAYAVLIQSLTDREAHFGYMDKDSFRTGRILHALGNVQLDRGFPDESEAYHQRALQQYQSTIGSNHHRTADVCHKVAQHCIRREEQLSARKLLKQALTVFKSKPEAYAPEIARSTFLLSRSYHATGDQSLSTTLFREAADLRHSIDYATTKCDRDLTEADFDELVTFWSK